jgi:tetratricopeptide (TPR) repeat protein
MDLNRVFCLSLYSRSVLCFLLLLAATIPAAAQGRSTISGYVFGPKRAPVGQVPVELRNEVNTVIGRTRTDASGRFIFRGVPSGRLSVTVLPLGTNLDSQSQEIELGSIGARGQLVPENVQLDFYLKPRKEGGDGADSGVVFFQEVPEDARRAYVTAIDDLESKRTIAGVAGLKRAIEIFPNYYLALDRLGLEQLKQEMFEDAVKTFSAALSVNNRSFSSFYGLCYANFALKNWEAAAAAAEKALEQEKNSVNALLLLGISQRNLRKYQEAEKTLLRAKKVDDVKTPDLYWNLALLYAYNLKKYQEAADALELYLKANPSIPDTTSIKKLIKQFRENRPPAE